MIREWLYYWLYAVDKYSLQSPFLFQFYNQFIKNSSTKPLGAVENLRKELLKNKNLINISDYGAGSVMNNQQKRSISYIAKTSASKPQFSLLLKNLIESYRFSDVLELGTSFGLNTLYMASSENDGDLVIHTIEGSEKIAEIAKANFNKSDKKNINIHIGNIDQLLVPVLDEMKKIDLAYMDANHTYEATIKYFETILPKTHENSIVLIDDIHWSPGMKRAWEELKDHPSVTQSVDIYDAGILFFSKGLHKKHYILEF